MTRRTRAERPGASSSPAGAVLTPLQQTVAALWADPAPRAVPPRSAATPGTTRLVAVPRAASARLLVPAHPARAAAGAVSRYSTALTTKERVTRVALATGLRLGGARLLPDGLEARGGGLVDHLAEVLGEPVVVSVGIGTARANRKPVLEVFDRAGRSLAFVKVGDTAVARDHVAGEERALRRIADATWDVVRIPRVLHCGEWDGALVLVVSTLATTPWPRVRDGLVGRAQDEVFASLGVQHAPLVDAPLWTQARTAADGLGEPGARLRAALDALEDRLPDRDVPIGSWHGDWTPWNMCPHRGRLHVWDWERFSSGVPAGLDAVHHAVNVATRARGASVDVVAGALARSSSDDLARAAYLVAVTARYLAAAADAGGEAIQPRADVFLDCLEREAGLHAHTRGHA